MASAAVIIIAVVVIYNFFIKGMLTFDGSTYNPIDHIGTVTVADSSGSFREIHA
ncbi:MAG: hypothetical protein ACI4J1_06485 [Ruminiclostridium sp.]